MKKLSFLIVLFMLNSSLLFSQVSINADGSVPDSSAGLDVKFNDKGFLMPRMTVFQQKMIKNPATGLIVFNIDSLDLFVFKGSYWVSVLKCDDKDTIFPWTCGDFIIDNRDNINYSTILIGTHCWLKENLHTSKYTNGDTLPNITDATTWSNLTIGAYCWYDNDSVTYENTYGKLYNWVAVSDSRGLCPTGWHAPSDAEWCTLSTNLDTTANCSEYGVESGISGGKMKESGLTHWASPNAGATNESGFTALPGGFRNHEGIFYRLTTFAFFWSSSPMDDYYGWMRYLMNDSESVIRAFGRMEGFSVRCIKDE